ncbi:MAG: two-component system sensor histidine kinase NtrB [Planctomycetota bacterium]|jgi:PAS domain S-box-containing protein
MAEKEPTRGAFGAGGFYRSLCENAAVAMVATDSQFRIVSWNAAAGRLLGRDAEDMLGRSASEAVPENRRKLFERLLRRTASRGVTSEFEISLPGPKGRKLDLLVVLSRIPGASDQAAQGVAAWIIDQRQRKDLSERLAQAEKMASLGTLASGVAHHFNNILGGVATFVDFALTSGDPAAAKRALQMTAEATARASKITQQLLSFARSDLQKADLADLTEVVLTFVHLVEHPLAEKNIKLQLDLKPAPIVAVEAKQMHQALGNLLVNAEDAMPDGGTLYMGIQQASEKVQLVFADTGLGVRPEHLPLIFEPFFTTKGLHSGGERANPGLGLSVVHGIITDMGGRIEVESTPGEGTKFIISFAVGENEKK